MQRITVTVGSDGRVAIPGTPPGQTITLQITGIPAPEEPTGPTLATVRTDDERAAAAAEIKRLAHELRQECDVDDERLSVSHGDLLYDERGPPK